jgi:hypothetical protein
MRLRSTYIIVSVIGLIGVFFAVAWFRTSGTTGASADPKEFLEEARALRESGRGSTVSDGLLHADGSDAVGIAKLELETDHLEIDEIDNAKPTISTIAVYNRGNAPLRIKTIRTSCACTQGELPTNSTDNDGRPVSVIPPGGQLPMTVTIDPFRIPGFSSTKILTLMSNDPVSPSVEVPVTVTVRPELTLEPENLDLGTIQNGEPAEARIILRQADVPDLDVTGLRPGRNATRNTGPDQKKAASGDVQYELELVERPQSEWKSSDRKEWEIVVRLAPNLPVGAFYDSFHILTNTKRIDTLPYKLSANVESFFSVTPTMLSVRNAVEPGASQIATAVVSSESDFVLDDLEVTGEAFSVAVREGDKPNTKFIDLGVRSDAGPGLKNESVSFTVRSGEKHVKHTLRAFASVTG